MRPGIWISTLFAAEEIPSAIVTFVALLMFLQTGASIALSTTLAALLFLPCILKSFLRAWVRRAGHFREMLLLIESLVCITLFALAGAFTQGIWYVFAALMLTSFLVAWHELAARMYYERMLYSRQQRFYTNLKIASAQLAVILTYGVMIIMVGNLEVFFRQIRNSWAMGCYVTAGAFMFFTVLHILILQSPQIGNRKRSHSMGASVMAEVHVIERIREQPDWWKYVLSIFLLLLPQSLMFLTRVHYLFDKASNGGIGCTLQEIGFAQGTVGVIAIRTFACRISFHDNEPTCQPDGTLHCHISRPTPLRIGIQHLPRTAKHGFGRALPQLCQPAQRPPHSHMHAAAHDGKRLVGIMAGLPSVLPPEYPLSPRLLAARFRFAHIL